MTAWNRMVVGVVAVYLLFKALTARRLAVGRGIGYWMFWPGMDARPFAETGPAAGPELMAWGLLKMSLGSVLLLLRTGISAVDLVLVFAGIGLLVHFGVCDVLAGFWRARGVAVGRLFVNPAASRSLGEFWGRRWNLAFHVVARDYVFKPVARRWGGAAGILATFLFSGILHEILLSVPAGGGYGLPTGYFVLHGLLVLAERRWRIEHRAWALFWILAPAPMLFHPWLVRAILWPLL
jgi:hypothetical protein